MIRVIFLVQELGLATQHYENYFLSPESLPEEGQDFKINGFRAHAYRVVYGVLDGKVTACVYSHRRSLTRRSAYGGPPKLHQLERHTN